MSEVVLVVDDDVALNRMIVLMLQQSGFETFSAMDGLEALKLAYQHHPDLVCLDVMLPEIDGWQVCERLRQLSDVPVMFLTAKNDQEAVEHGLTLGADDYLTKPFHFKELELRIATILRRVTRERSRPTPVYDDGCLRIDLEQQHVYRRGELVHLSPTEFRLLEYLVKQRGKVVAHQELLSNVWGEAYRQETHSLALYIRYLREKLEADPSNPGYIRTAWGRGYWFDPDSKTFDG